MNFFMKKFSRNIRIFFVLLSVFFIVTCCKTKENITTNSLETVYRNIASQNLEQPINYLLNADKQYVLCYHETPSAGGWEGRNRVDFLVIKIDNSEIVYKEKTFGGTVIWLDNKRIKITYTTGNVAGNANNSVIYDVVEKKVINN